MPDLAELNLVINSDQVVRSQKDLKGLEEQANRTEGATDKMTKGAKGAGDAHEKAGKQAEAAAKGHETLDKVAEKVTETWHEIVTEVTNALGVYVLLSGTVGQVAKAFEEASFAEKSQFTFSYLTGSAQEAQKTLKELDEFASETPFSVPGVTQAAKVLLQAGGDAEHLTSILKILADVTAANGGGETQFVGMAQTLARVAQMGELTTFQIRSLEASGIHAGRILSEELGKPQAEVMKLLETRTLSARDAINLLLDGMSRQAPDAAKKFTETVLEGQVDAIQRAVYETYKVFGVELVKSAGVHEFLAELESDVFKVKAALESAQGQKFIDDLGAIAIIVLKILPTLGQLVGVYGALKLSMLAVDSVTPLLRTAFGDVEAAAASATGRLNLMTAGLALLVTGYIRAQATGESFAESTFRIVNKLGLVPQDLANKGEINSLIDDYTRYKEQYQALQATVSETSEEQLTTEQKKLDSLKAQREALAQIVLIYQTESIKVSKLPAPDNTYTQKQIDELGDAQKRAQDENDLDRVHQIQTEIDNLMTKMKQPAQVDVEIKQHAMEAITALHQLGLQISLEQQKVKDAITKAAQFVTVAPGFELPKKDLEGAAPFAGSRATTQPTTEEGGAAAPPSTQPSGLPTHRDFGLGPTLSVGDANAVRMLQEIIDKTTVEDELILKTNADKESSLAYEHIISTLSGESLEKRRQEGQILGLTVEQQKQLTDMTQKYRDALKELGVDQTVKSLRDQTEQLKEQQSSYGKSAEDAQTLLTLEKARYSLGTLTAEQEKKITDEVEKQKELKEVNDALEKQKQLATEFGNTIAGALGKMIEGGHSMKDVLKDMVMQLEQSIITMLIIQPLAQAISNTLQGIGNTGQNTGASSAGAGVLGIIQQIGLAFVGGSGGSGGSGGKTVGNAPRPTAAHALGDAFGATGEFSGDGVYSEPTSFNDMGGGNNVLGEKGPEAVLPLTRGPGGSLGVQSNGGSSTTVVNHYHTWNIQTPNADSFKMSKRQVMGQFSAATKR